MIKGSMLSRIYETLIDALNISAIPFYHVEPAQLTMKPEIVKVGALCSVIGPDCRNIMIKRKDRRDSIQILEISISNITNSDIRNININYYYYYYYYYYYFYYYYYYHHY